MERSSIMTSIALCVELTGDRKDWERCQSDPEGVSPPTRMLRSDLKNRSQTQTVDVVPLNIRCINRQLADSC